MSTAKVGLFVRLEVKPDKVSAVADFLRGGLALVKAEPQTLSWYALQINETTFAIYDVFSTEEGRNAHLTGKVAEALFAQASDLLASPPVVEKFNVLAVKA